MKSENPLKIEKLKLPRKKIVHYRGNERAYCIVCSAELPPQIKAHIEKIHICGRCVQVSLNCTCEELISFNEFVNSRAF